MEPQEFKFKYTVITVTARLDDIDLTVKQGIRTWKANVARLKHLYVINHKNVGQEMILTYETGPNQLKRIRVNASFGEPGFDALLKALLARRPEIDIRDLPLNEAHKLMGAPNFVKWAPPIAILIVVAVVGVGFVPSFLHGLDSGEQTIDVSQCALSCDVDTRNLKVRGKLLFDASIEKKTTTTRSGSTTVTIQYYVPLVPEDWKPGEPVYMVVETPDLSDAQFDELAGLDAVPGVLRNIWWEGLDGDDADYFSKKIGLKLADEVRLLEYKADTRFMLWLGVGAVGLTLVIMLIVAFIIARRGGTSRAAGKKS